jgi:integrase
MKVEVRERKINKGKVSLYLDIYHEGEREYKFLKLYPLVTPRTKEERLANSEIWRKANALRIKTENDLINQHEIRLGLKKSDIYFLDYFQEQVAKKKKSPGNYGNWDSAYKILRKYYSNKKVKLVDITAKDLEDIKNYFLNIYTTKSELHLSQNAAVSYFNKVKASLHIAFDERLISDKIWLNIKSIATQETRREYLTEEELIKIINTECEFELLKKAFLFSVYTGLRWSDVNKLLWKDIQYTSDAGYSIHYEQKKTGSIEYHPIAQKAITLIGDSADAEQRVFKGLKYSAWHNLKLAQWMMKAGITKKITFHSARHTYATLLLTKNVDMAVVSKLLGHKEIKTTQIYAKVIDQRKIDAAKIIDLL